MAVTPLRIDLGTPDFLEKIEGMGALNILKCYQCGTCSAGCPAMIDELNPRRLMKLMVYGLKNMIMENRAIWSCTSCHQCSERCPEGAFPFEMIMAIRRIQSQDGLLPKPLRKVCSNLMQWGHTVNVEEKHRKARQAVGLPELPPTIISHPEMEGDMRAIAEARGIIDLIEGGGD